METSFSPPKGNVSASTDPSWLAIPKSSKTCSLSHILTTWRKMSFDGCPIIYLQDAFGDVLNAFYGIGYSKRVYSYWTPAEQLQPISLQLYSLPRYAHAYHCLNGILAHGQKVYYTNCSRRQCRHRRIPSRAPPKRCFPSGWNATAAPQISPI